MSKKEGKKAVKSQDDTNKQKVNFEELIVANLSNFRLVQDNSGYHYTQLNLKSKNLDGLNAIFNNYKYVEQIDLSCNNLADFSALTNMQFLIRLDLEQNNIKDLKALANEEGFKSLKYLNLTNNKIADLTPIKVPLVELYLNDNKIEKVETFDGHPKIRVLKLRNNKIGGLTQFANMPELKELRLTRNKIKSVAGLEGIPTLQFLKLRGNIIEAFDETFPALENLQQLDIRDNKIDKFEEIAKLVSLPNLKRLLYKGNGFELKYPNYLLDTINLMVKIEKINNIFVTKQLKLKAFQYQEERYLKEQELKRIQEEEERAKLEQPQD